MHAREHEPLLPGSARAVPAVRHKWWLFAGVMLVSSVAAILQFDLLPGVAVGTSTTMHFTKNETDTAAWSSPPSTTVVAMDVTAKATALDGEDASMASLDAVCLSPRLARVPEVKLRAMASEWFKQTQVVAWGVFSRRGRTPASFKIAKFILRAKSTISTVKVPPQTGSSHVGLAL